MLVIDSNIWAYAFDSTCPEHKKASRAVEKTLEEDILVNTAIQLEVAHHLVKRLGVVAGQESANAFLSMPFIVDVLDEELVRSSVSLLARHSHLGIGGRDASILASMARHNVRKILTHDHTFRRIEGIEVSDPIG